MTIDRLLFLLRISHSILVSEHELWLASHVAQDTAKELQRGLRRHRAGVRLLLAWAAIDACPSPDLHRQYWRYAGAGRFSCEMCEQLQEWIA